MTEERSLLLVVVIGPKTQISISAEWQTQIKGKELPAFSTRYIPKACGKKTYGKIMERRKVWEGYSAVCEAGTESMGTGGAVAGVCGAGVSCG